MCVPLVKHREPDSIEPNEPLFCSKPDVAITRLHNRIHRVLRETFLCSPYPVCVAGERADRFLGKKSLREENERERREEKGIPIMVVSYQHTSKS